MKLTKANLLVARYLSPRDEDDKLDALNGLIGCCWKAKGNLFIPIDGHTLADGTIRFIEMQLQWYLRRYRHLAPNEVKEQASKNEFRHIPRIVKFRMIDHIRKYYRAKPKPEQERREPVLTPEYMKIWRQTIKNNSGQLIKALGKGRYETLCVLLDSYESGRTKRDRKGHSTRCISKTRAVSEQQARTDKRQLSGALADSHNPIVVSLRQSPIFLAIC